MGQFDRAEEAANWAGEGETGERGGKGLVAVKKEREEPGVGDTSRGERGRGNLEEEEAGGARPGLNSKRGARIP